MNYNTDNKIDASDKNILSTISKTLHQYPVISHNGKEYKKECVCVCVCVCIVRQSCILSPCLFNFSAQYIMQNARLAEAQAGINIARGNINNLRYVDDTALMAESEEELESLLMKVKERVKRLA